MREVFIVAAKRTPIGSFMGSLSAVPASELGAIALRGAMEQVHLPPEAVEEVYFGNVLSANLGQAPATQVVLKAGLPPTTPATLVNKVCASGLKAVMIGAQTVALGYADIIAAGGMESMSLTPFYAPGVRNGYRYGHVQLLDGILRDGLEDAYCGLTMGLITETCAATYNLSRQMQDEYAILSYKRAQEAQAKGIFSEEIVPVPVKQRSGDLLISEDEEPKKANFEKIPTLKPAFKSDGTITAANASKINDGAAAVILASEAAVKKYGLRPLARVLSWADAAREPEWFTIAPTDAIRKALERASLSIEQIDVFEINEAFSAVALANQHLLGIPIDKLNVFGGAVALGHPLGASGTRILVTLLTALRHTGGKYGAIGICNGGGGASAMIVERLAE
ncbi:MAG: acetyl-CoA C-acyltransferase [Bacteroidia bacterium]|nr:acetyl-CoA C-acyltransferase [Bacteroidia bacterium]MCX7765056.1 acetyl-CoA C-acyltransferase [Bacteroidia bacterium]MDW8417709.1 acetyl-CoA C-acyltransferase [Bacteroidia bacterium]